jgi:5'-AMP-activated protein kinase catalytic alpha subunit
MAEDQLKLEKEKLKQYILGKSNDNKELKQVSHFMIQKTLGEGTFGKVKLGVQTITGEKVAIKILEKTKIQDQTDVDRIAREIKILKKIRHPYVI